MQTNEEQSDVQFVIEELDRFLNQVDVFMHKPQSPHDINIWRWPEQDQAMDLTTDNSSHSSSDNDTTTLKNVWQQLVSQWNVPNHTSMINHVSVFKVSENGVQELPTDMELLETIFGSSSNGSSVPTVPSTDDLLRQEQHHQVNDPQNVHDTGITASLFHCIKKWKSEFHDDPSHWQSRYTQALNNLQTYINNWSSLTDSEQHFSQQQLKFIVAVYEMITQPSQVTWHWNQEEQNVKDYEMFLHAIALVDDKCSSIGSQHWERLVCCTEDMFDHSVNGLALWRELSAAQSSVSEKKECHPSLSDFYSFIAPIYDQIQNEIAGRGLKDQLICHRGRVVRLVEWVAEHCPTRNETVVQHSLLIQHNLMKSASDILNLMDACLKQIGTCGHTEGSDSKCCAVCRSLLENGFAREIALHTQSLTSNDDEISALPQRLSLSDLERICQPWTSALLWNIM